MPSPLVSIIIPHYSGAILKECLETLYSRSGPVHFEVIVVDDRSSSDGSVEEARRRFPSIRVIRTEGGRGFGVSCNRGFDAAKGVYAVLLNNDVEVSEGWLEKLVERLESDPRIAIAQSKLLSKQRPDRFDQGGGAGGLFDLFGYPFTLGSLLHHVEEDRGQYDGASDIFWACGAVMIVRMSALSEIGRFDEAFYMQMEDIDLSWRARQLGFRVVAVTDSLAYHHGGWTLRRDSFHRQYLNHRNSLVLLIKHAPLRSLLWIFPVRLLMDVATVLAGVFYYRQWKQPAGILAAFGWLAAHPAQLWRRRNDVKAARRESGMARMPGHYAGSILIDYFLRGRRTASSVMRESVRC